MAATKSRAKRHPSSSTPTALDHIDELDACCAQAIAIATLVTDVESDRSIRDAAWAIARLVERAEASGRSLFELVRRAM